MRQVEEMPQAGQFVAMWEFRGMVWSATFRWVDGVLLERDSTSEDRCSVANEPTVPGTAFWVAS